MIKSQEIKNQFDLFNLLYPQGLRKLCFMFGDYCAGVNYSNYLKSLSDPKLGAERSYLVKILTIQ